VTNSDLVERAGVSDFPKLMQMLIECFSQNVPNHPPFEILFPDSYSTREEDMANNFILRDKGIIVSCVGLFPMPLSLCGTVVEVGGIGGVCTRPEYRGKDFMQRLMDHVQKEMVRREYPFGWLWGDRRRYETWGYEVSCLTHKFDLTSRGPGLEKYRGTLPGKIQEGTVDELDWETLWTQVGNNPFLTACGKENLRLKYKRLNQKILMVAGAQGGHVVIHESGPGRTVRAYGGNPKTVGAILTEKLNAGWTSLEAFLPFYPDSFFDVFKDLMSGYQVRFTGNIAIMNLKKTFQCFLPHFNQQVSSLGLKGKVKIVMGPARELPRQEIILEADGKELSITAGLEKPFAGAALELTCFQMTETLFSSLGLGWLQGVDRRVQWLAALMPVPLSIPLIYWV
jgi:hypothetical protein